MRLTRNEHGQDEHGQNEHDEDEHDLGRTTLLT